MPGGYRRPSNCTVRVTEPEQSGLIEQLALKGYAIAPDFFKYELCASLQQEADALSLDGGAHEAGIGRGRDQQIERRVRRARIQWFYGSTPGQLELLAEAEKLRIHINKLLFLGLFEFEAQIALTPVGGFYARHIDSFHGSRSRIVSLVAYLNDDWATADGGCLRIWPPSEHSHSPPIDVVPRRGTLILMLSEKVDHEVMLCHRARASVAGWFRLRSAQH